MRLTTRSDAARQMSGTLTDMALNGFRFMTNSVRLFPALGNSAKLSSDRAYVFCQWTTRTVNTDHKFVFCSRDRNIKASESCDAEAVCLCLARGNMIQSQAVHAHRELKTNVNVEFFAQKSVNRSRLVSSQTQSVGKTKTHKTSFQRPFRFSNMTCNDVFQLSGTMSILVSRFDNSDRGESQKDTHQLFRQGRRAEW